MRKTVLRVLAVTFLSVQVKADKIYFVLIKWLNLIHDGFLLLAGRSRVPEEIDELRLAAWCGNQAGGIRIALNCRGGRRIIAAASGKERDHQNRRREKSKDYRACFHNR
jgi:hypothetical protein